MRGQIKLRWIITCGRCDTIAHFLGHLPSGKDAAIRHGWLYGLTDGYLCPDCRKKETEAPACPA